MSFLVAILAFVVDYYDCCEMQRLSLGRQPGLKRIVIIVVVVVVVVVYGGDGVLHGCL